MNRPSDPRAAIAEFVDRAYAALDQVDYYRVLGVSSAATEAQIRDSYYRMATRLHPDVHGEGIDPAYRARLTAVFSRVVEAYKVLSVEDRRSEYDLGLAQGRLRLRVGTRARASRPVDQIRAPKGRRFFELGEAALEDGNGRAAVTNFRLALSMEPDSEVIKEALARAERLVKG